MIVSILIAIIFTVLLAKAIIETIWGLMLIVWGLFLHAIALVLDTIAMIIRIGEWIAKKFRRKPRRPMTLAESLVVYYQPGSPRAKSILASLR